MVTSETIRSRGEWARFDSDGVDLNGYIARPVYSAASGAGRHGLVLCHGFPQGLQPAGEEVQGYPQLAERLSAETGAVVLTFNFRGTGTSGGDFSLGGWLADLHSAIRQLRAVPGVDHIWLVGFAAGGTLALCAAGEDTGVRGVAAFAPPADFAERANDPRRFVAQARQWGLIRSPGFPEDLESWARELREIRPLQLVGKVPPRPIMIVQGGGDEVVPLVDARALADASNHAAELKVLAGAGHRLQHDPRAIAILLGWLDRQMG